MSWFEAGFELNKTVVAIQILKLRKIFNISQKSCPLLTAIKTDETWLN